MIRIFCLLLISLQALSQFEETVYFRFHSNYWINLHHYLYQQASGNQLRKMQEDGETFLDIGEKGAIEKLSKEEREILDEGIQFYKDSINQYSLFKLSKLRTQLQGLEKGEARLRSGIDLVPDSVFSPSYAAVLNQTSDSYIKSLWPLHSAQNEKILGMHLAMIKELEPELIKQLEGLAGAEWPDQKVRTDLTAYANWAGAYTPTQPQMNIFISTLDPGAPTSIFIETVFHEGTHLLFTRESEFRSLIYFKSKELETEFPRDLWHASQFYLCGRAVQDALKARGIDHELFMDVKNVFSSFNTQEFRAVLEEYYQGRKEREETVVALLEQLK